jgi:hypothetical protein
MKKAFVAIGVNTTGGLATLKGAASGACDIAVWAIANGFDVSLFEDSGGAPVKLADISAAIRQIVNSKTYDQLVVYFSGHGILRGPDYEIWLLSAAPQDANEAVNVSGSILLARNCGISHLVIISDACRSLPSLATFGQVSGSVIFPNAASRTPRPEVDVFYATLPGDPALELPPNPAVNAYHGIFSQCLLDALRGHVPAVIQPFVSSAGAKSVIPSRPLKLHLEIAVPSAVSVASLVSQQDPEIRVESDLPKYLAEVSALSAPGPTAPSPGRSPGPPAPTVESAPRPKTTISRVAARYRERIFNPGWKSADPTTLTGPAADYFAESMNRILAAKGRESFETRTGFTVSGAKVLSAKSTGAECDVFEESGAYQIRVHLGDSAALTSERPRVAHSTLIRLANGCGTWLATLSGYIATVLVEEDRVVSVNYTPSRGTERYADFQMVAKEVEQRRSYAAVAARNGVFKLERSVAADGANYLRALKAIDPTLGLYATYAYAQAGDDEGVKSVLRYMEADLAAVPFDVVMLAHEQDPLQARWFNPMMPMLTQGWALFDAGDTHPHPLFLKMRRYLIPSLWTTFSDEGVDFLTKYLKRTDPK